MFYVHRAKSGSRAGKRQRKDKAMPVVSIGCKQCHMNMLVPPQYKDLTLSQIEALGLVCPSCLKEKLIDNIDSAALHLSSSLENLFEAGATAVTAAKQQLKPTVRGILTQLRDQLDKVLDEQAPKPPEQPQ